MFYFFFTHTNFCLTSPIHGLAEEPLGALPIRCTCRMQGCGKKLKIKLVIDTTIQNYKVNYKNMNFCGCCCCVGIHREKLLLDTTNITKKRSVKIDWHVIMRMWIFLSLFLFLVKTIKLLFSGEIEKPFFNWVYWSFFFGFGFEGRWRTCDFFSSLISLFSEVHHLLLKFFGL